MILHPGVLALVAGSTLSVLGLGLAAVHGARVVRGWESGSGRASQLALERAEPLAAAALRASLALELASLLVFVFTADRLAIHLTGAMCAVGALGASPWGWPTLALRSASALGAALWLALDRLDGEAEDLPLVRARAWLALALLPLGLAAAGAQLGYFGGLDLRVSVSCCSTSFVAAGRGLPGLLAGLDPAGTRSAFGLAAVLVLLLGPGARRGRGVPLYAAASLAFAALGAGFVVAVVAPHVYAHPHHHCPFCLLKPEHGRVGFLLALPLAVGLAAALSAGAYRLLGHAPSLAGPLPGLIRAQVDAALAGQVAFVAVAALLVLRSPLVLTP